MSAQLQIDPGQKLTDISTEWTVENLDYLNQQFLLSGTNVLSPYPKDYESNMKKRLELLRRAKTDDLFREKLRRIFFQDPLFAFNMFFYTLDVRRKPRHHRPFTTYWYQDLVILTTIHHINQGIDLAEEKSRDMGASWLKVGCLTWLWLQPTGGYDFLIGSRIQDYVDKKGDPRTLFEKVRYLLKRLPSWLLPKGFNPRKHDFFMRLLNPESGASITGESNNASFSTGGRYRAIFVDEFAKWENTDKAAWTAMADATPCRLPVSTPFGAYGQYYEIVTDGQTKKLTIHWSLHPRKNENLYCVYPKPKDLPDGKVIDWLHWKGEKPWLRSPWYDKECARRDRRTIAQELDIDYIGAGSPVFSGVATARILELLRANKKPLRVRSFDSQFESFHQDVDLSESFDFEDKLVIWKEPTNISLELFGVDVVEGKEHGDYAIICGFDRNTRSVCMSFFSRCDEVMLAKAIKTIDNWLCSIKYRELGRDSSLFEPYWAIEVNGPGLSTFDLCLEYGVVNLFMTPNFDSVREQVVYQKGWRTTGSSKKKIVGAIKNWLIEGTGWAPPRTAREMTSFVYKTPNHPEAATGANDDEVMALGIALVVDELMPGAEWRAPEEYREDGLSAKLFSPDRKQNSETVENYCLQTIINIKNLTVEPGSFYG